MSPARGSRRRRAAPGSRLTSETDTLRNLVTRNIAKFVTSVLQIAVALSVMIVTSWRLTLVATVVLPLALFLAGCVTLDETTSVEEQAGTIGRVPKQPPLKDLEQLPGDLQVIAVPGPSDLGTYVVDMEIAKALGKALGMARDLADSARESDFLRLVGDIVTARQSEDTFKTFREAGKALGMTWAQTMRRVILPLLLPFFGMITLSGLIAGAEERGRLDLPGGHKARIRYAADAPPVLSARIQDLYDLHETPTIAMGRTPLLIEILAPNQRPVQVTQDLPGFWVKHYPALRKQLMRRYPKHAWPEDPTQLIAGDD